MGKKKVKSKRKSELRIIFFIILVALALFIVSTYAWFSTQKNVSITNLSGIVEVAEGLEISLDAENWFNEIVLGEDMNIIDDAYANNRNIHPQEMLPVSTLAIPNSTRETDLTMIRGKVTNSIKLSKMIEMNETLATPDVEKPHNSEADAYPGYFAFDIFLKNSSKQYDFDDVLQLNYDSSLHIIEDGDDSVGLQNTVRVALAKYGSGRVLSGDVNTGKDIIREGVSDVMADPATILNETGAVEGGNTVYISDVTMWEPNSTDHVDYIVTNNNKITWSKPWATKLFGSDTKVNEKFTSTMQIPTYALKESVLDVTDLEIADIYKWDGTESYLQEQNALQTSRTSAEDYTIKEGVQDLFSTADKEVPFTLAPNSIIRMRVYVWLEGQDVDCINYASHGGGVTLNLGLVKGSTLNSHGDAGTTN